MIDLMPRFGALESRVDLRDYKYYPKICGAFDEDLPESFSLTPPSVKNQGTVNSCVAHVACSIEEYFNAKYCDYHKELSVGYVYGCRYEYKGEGMYLRDALKTLKNRGVCTYKEFPFNEEVPTITSLFESKKSWMTDSSNKISSYFTIERDNLTYNMKKALMNYGPIMASIRWHKDFKVDRLTGCIESQFNSNMGLHCVMIYGWNKDGWLIQNSWGEEWGNEGRAVYKFEYSLAEVWGITDLDITHDSSMSNIDINGVKDSFYKICNSIINGFTKMKLRIRSIFNKSK